VEQVTYTPDFPTGLIRTVADATKLSLEQAIQVCNAWAPLGGHVFENAAHLQRARFTAFLPGFLFDDSFCATETELEIHRRYIRERGKEIFGTPCPAKATFEERRRFYRSEFNEVLREENNRLNAGIPRAEMEMWRLEIDPCTRARMRAWLSGSVAYDARVGDLLQRQRYGRAVELEWHYSGLSANYSLSADDRMQFYLAVMQRHAPGLGFSLDLHKSHSTFPVFSRPLNAAWDLCLTLLEPQALGSGPGEGALSLHLELRHRSLAGDSRLAAAGQLLSVPYNRAIPSFCTTYREFRTLEELELIVRAHLCLLEPNVAAIAEGARPHLPA
jgi:hypothetical protein